MPESITTLEATLELDASARLGEGAIWHPQEQLLYWVDIEGKALHRYNPITKTDTALDVGARIGTVVPVAGGGVLVALQNGIHHLDTQTGVLTYLTNPISEEGIRFNEGKCDPAGRFWVGTMALDTRAGAAKLYRMGSDHQVKEMLSGLTISNGIAWSSDAATMYFTDTPTQQIKAFDYAVDTGEISNGRVVVTIPDEEGAPDGMTLDAEGNLWVALHGAGMVAKYNPLTGQQLQRVTVPATNTTSCAFGGKNLDTLYITTGSEWLSDEKLLRYPLSGGLFSVKPGVCGVAANFYAG